VFPSIGVGFISNRKKTDVKKLKLLSVAALATTIVSAANAGTTPWPVGKAMSIEFVGEWCLAADGYDAKTKTTNYKLPSWTEDGQCARANILRIEPYSFYFSDTDEHCDEVVSARYKSDTAPSGTAYMAKITVNCSPSGIWTPKLKTFEFERYKGNLYIKRR
jgi:hypothetical protein